MTSEQHLKRRQATGHCYVSHVHEDVPEHANKVDAADTMHWEQHALILTQQGIPRCSPGKHLWQDGVFCGRLLQNACMKLGIRDKLQGVAGAKH